MAEESPSCPKCPYGALLPTDSGRGFAVDECPDCKGRWYDLGELGKAAADPARFEKACQGWPLRPRPTERRCPRCGVVMVNGGLANELLRVDCCPACRGFWVDPGELRLIDQLLAS